jgi:hypothetical protein
MTSIAWIIDNARNLTEQGYSDRAIVNKCNACLGSGVRLQMARFRPIPDMKMTNIIENYLSSDVVSFALAYFLNPLHPSLGS